jgi:hypothetical protein
MPDPFDALVADLRTRSEREWELLIIADWPTYSVSEWPKERHAPFAPALPPDKWCRDVRDMRAAVLKELRKAGRGGAIAAAEKRATEASSRLAIDTAGSWTDMLGLPMHAQAAKSVLWIVALYRELNGRQFVALWAPYSEVATFLIDFENQYLPPEMDPELEAAIATASRNRSTRATAGTAGSPKGFLGRLRAWAAARSAWS